MSHQIYAILLWNPERIKIVAFPDSCEYSVLITQQNSAIFWKATCNVESENVSMNLYAMKLWEGRW
jgi:hypothetical protein